MRRDQELSRRLQAATDLHIDSSTRQDHMAAIRAAAELAGPPQVQAATTRVLRRRLVAATAAAVLIVPGVAVAAENSAPGSVLYPVKRTTEAVRSLVDGDIVARHRIEELEDHLRDDAPVADLLDALERAEVAVGAGTPDELLHRLDLARQEVTFRADAQTDDNDPKGGEPEEHASRDTAEPDEVGSSPTPDTAEPGEADDASDVETDEPAVVGHTSEPSGDDDTEHVSEPASEETHEASEPDSGETEDAEVSTEADEATTSDEPDTDEAPKFDEAESDEAEDPSSTEPDEAPTSEEAEDPEDAEDAPS